MVADMIGAAMRSWVQSQLQEIIIFHENFCSDVSSGSTLRYHFREWRKIASWPEEAWSSGQSGGLWIIEAGGPGFDSSSDQVFFSSLLGHRR